MEISASTRIDRPVGDVWRFYAIGHVENHPRWDPDMQLEQITPGPVGLGTRVHRRNTRWGAPVEGEMEVTEWQPERALATHIRDANMEIRGRATMEPVSADQTDMTITVDVPNLDEPRAAVMRERMQRTVENIKALVESEV